MSVIIPVNFLCVGFPDGSSGEESACNARDRGDEGLIAGWGRSPGGGHGSPLQDSCVENPMDRGAWWAIVHRGGKESDTTEQPCTHTYALRVSETLYPGTYRVQEEQEEPRWYNFNSRVGLS